MNTTDKEELKTYWWYRLVQVVYSTLVIFLLIVGIASVAASFPSLNRYASTYQTKCADGRLRGNIEGDFVNYLTTDFEKDYMKEVSRFVCSTNEELTGDNLHNAYLEAQKNKIIPAKKNYEVVIKEKVYYGNWWHPVIAFLASIILIPLLSMLIRAIFLYVVVGSPFWKTFFIRRDYDN